MPMHSSDVVRIGDHNRLFTKEEANALIPLITFIAKRHDVVIKGIQKSIKKAMIASSPKQVIMDLEHELTQETLRWKTKYIKLGVMQLSGGFILFTSNEGGYWVWYTQDTTIKYSLSAGETLDKIRTLAWKQ